MEAEKHRNANKSRFGLYVHVFIPCSDDQRVVDAKPSHVADKVHQPWEFSDKSTHRRWKARKGGERCMHLVSILINTNDKMKCFKRQKRMQDHTPIPSREVMLMHQTALLVAKHGTA